MPAFSDVTGLRFARWIVLKRDLLANPRETKWLCRCDCGAERSVSASTLKNGASRSCGCLARELKHSRTIHGAATVNGRTPEYLVWTLMKRRCENKKDPSFTRYGARGIAISEEWRAFENFLRDMGARPSPRHSIDRIDNALGYSKGNCRWATAKEQARNRRSNVFIDTPCGPMVMAEAAEVFGISQSTLHRRICLGWKGVDLFKPLRAQKPRAAKAAKFRTVGDLINHVA